MPCRQVRRYLLALPLFLLSAAVLQAATYYVKPDGNDQAEGTKAATAFKTLTRAAQAFNHGDSLVLAPGSYRENVFLAERFAADGSVQTITGDEDGKLTGAKPGPVFIEAADPAKPALHIYRFGSVTISGLTFRGNGQGLRLEKCGGKTKVQRCTFDGLSRGLVLVAQANTEIVGCVVSRCILGITVQASNGTVVRHCTIAASSTAGVLVLASGGGVILNSIITGNNTNFITDRISATVWRSNYNAVTGTCGPWGDVPAVANIYEWASASGQDRDSVYVIPEFADPANFDLHLSPRISWPGGRPILFTPWEDRKSQEKDRDGGIYSQNRNLVALGAYDYPPATSVSGWQALGIALLPTVDTGTLGHFPVRQSAGIYREDGTLVRTLLADVTGVTDLYWDGLDDQGQPVPAGKYEVRAVTHNVRIVDDGAFGDDGNPLGAYNCDNADRVVALPDGGFVITTVYDEGGYPLRAYTSTGQPIFANNLAEKDFSALCLVGQDLYATVGAIQGNCGLQHFLLPGERAPMANGAEAYSILTKEEIALVVADQKLNADYQQAVRTFQQNLAAAKATEKDAPAKPALKNYAVGGLAVIGSSAYVSLIGFDLVRVFDLATGQKKGDWPLPGVADLATDGKGTLWALAGKDVVQLDPASGAVKAKLATGLEAPRYLAASAAKLAVVDRANARIALLNAAGGAVIRTLGQARPAGAWLPVSGNLFADPRGCAFLPDGKLVVTETGRTRILWAEEAKACQDILSNFMDIAVAHPQKPEYVYCHNMSVFRVDTKTGAWSYLVEGPHGLTRQDPKSGQNVPFRIGSVSLSAMLGGKPFIAACGQDGWMYLCDVSDPVKPRLAAAFNDPLLRLAPYSIISFTKGGDILANAGSYGTSFNRIPFKGLDGQGNPQFDFANPVRLGPDKDPVAGRGLKCINAPSADTVTGDIYYLAVTDAFCKMVPGWGADGSGVGRSTPDGKPLWFALSSGGNYQSGAVINDGKNAWYLAGKSFGGQIDLFDADGLRLTTGNWSWPCNYTIGFVDLRYGINPYIRPDGKVGAYVEDDAIGRFGRIRIEGADTVKRFRKTFEWKTPAAAPAAGAPLPNAQQVQGKPLEKALEIPRVAELPVNGDWEAWAKAGIVPQIVALPIPGFKRSFPDDLWQTFRAGTALGAVAHDGQNLYVYFLVADDTMHFDAANPGMVWMYDGVELWLEEEQIGLAFTTDGKPALFKFRYHNREGKEWSANYALAPENIWGAKLDNLAVHPLGLQLADITGVSFDGKKGYAVMGRIPFDEIKLVGGSGGRAGKEILPTTGKPGEIMRIGVSFGAISAWGREQDYKVNWPGSLMFADPTRSVPFMMK